MIKNEDEKFISAFGDMSGDAVNEDKCYYLNRLEEDDWSYKTKKFTRIEFYKPWFLYLQDFRSFEIWWNSVFWRCWGGNDKYEIKCSDIITLINNEKIKYDENLDIKNEELIGKFTSDEIEIIKFICYLFRMNNNSFTRVYLYLRKNLTCKGIGCCRRD